MAVNEAAQAAWQNWNVCIKPIKNNLEQIFAHDLVADSSGTVLAGIVNRNLNGGQGLGVYITYPQEAFPYFWIWKMNGQGIYSVALEPSTNTLEGRAKDREAGRLKFLKPGEKCVYDLEIGVLSNKDEINAFESRVRSRT